MIFWLKLILVVLWTGLVSTLGTIQALFHWGKHKHFSPSVHLLADGVLKILGIRFEMQGSENLGVYHPAIYLGNHQSFFDVIAYGSIVPFNCVPVGKKEIKKIPIVGWWFVGNGAILIDRQNRKSAFSELDKAISIMVEEKISIGVLPEGTRNTTSEELLPFKKGAFHMAIKAQAPVVPILFSNYSQLISWKKRTLKSGVIQGIVLPAIPTKGMTLEDIEPLIEKTRNLMLMTLRDLNQKAGV